MPVDAGVVVGVLVVVVVLAVGTVVVLIVGTVVDDGSVDVVGVVETVVVGVVSVDVLLVVVVSAGGSDAGPSAFADGRFGNFGLLQQLLGSANGPVCGAWSNVITISPSAW